jgi:hypothetical protein
LFSRFYNFYWQIFFHLNSFLVFTPTLNGKYQTLRFLLFTNIWNRKFESEKSTTETVSPFTFISKVVSIIYFNLIKNAVRYTFNSAKTFIIGKLCFSLSSSVKSFEVLPTVANVLFENCWIDYRQFKFTNVPRVT